MDEIEIDALARRARDGDRDAAAELLERIMPFLGAVARREAKGLLDPEDLQSQAVENLLRLWAKGAGPASGVPSYLARAMRNRVIDESRSPRSQTRNIDTAEDFVAADDPTVSVELDRERRWMQGALKRLAPDQRRLMIGIYFEDLKPGELATELGKSPNAVHSLHRRSKLALRRATLQEALAENAPATCRAAAELVPNVVDVDFTKTDGNGPGFSHIASCSRCQTAWKRFGSIASTLGIGGLLALVSGRPAPAWADELDADGESAEDADSRTGPDEGVDDQVDPPASVDDPPGSPPAGAADALRPARWRYGAIGALIGAFAGALTATLLCQHTDLRSPAPRGSLMMSVDHRKDIAVRVEFDIGAEGWQVDHFELSFPATLELLAQPEGWRCVASATAVRCDDSGEHPLDGTFTFDGETVLGEELALSLRATAGDHVFRGSVHSEVPASGDVITARADVLGDHE